MKRNFPSIPFHVFCYSKPSLNALVLCILLLSSLGSCDTGSKGRYKFQSESMHWLQFRGPNSSGIAPENADPPVHFCAETNLLWKTEILPGWSSPCIVDEKIFLTGFDDSDSLLYTVAINRKNGEIIWKDSIQPHDFYLRHILHGYANPTVASNGEMVFASFPNYGLIAYDLDGIMQWEYPHEVISYYYNAGTSSPIITDSIVIQLVNSNQDPRIVALDTRTGDSVWTIRAQDYQWSDLRCSSSPIIYKNMLILHLSNTIVAYNLVDGSPVWWLFTPTTGVGTPAIKDDMLYINTWTNMGEKQARGEFPSFAELLEESDKNNNGLIEREEFKDDMLVFTRPETPDAPDASLYFKDDMVFNYFDVNKDWAFGEDEWNKMNESLTSYMEDHGMLAISMNGSGERALTDIKWKVNKDTPETPSPLAIADNVLFIKDGGIITVINMESGEVVHKDRIGANGTYLSSPMLAGNRVYTCSFNGTVTVLSAEDFSILAHNKLKEKIGASPVAVDDVLYVRTDKHLYAFSNL